MGLRFDGTRATHLLSVLRSAVSASGSGSPRQYLDSVRADRGAFDELVDQVTVGETFFFRHPEQLAFLRDVVLPQLATARPRGTGLRLWSAGCASGEEAYTLAMLLENAGIHNATILATDISTTQLQEARAATYRQWSMRGAAEHAHRFEKVGNRYRVPTRLTARVEVRKLNLLQDPYPTDVDVLMCRNVLLYLPDDAIRGVALRMAQALAPGGWLITAPTDPDLDFQGRLEPVMTPGGMFHRRSDGSMAPPPPPPPPSNEGEHLPPVGSAPPTAGIAAGGVTQEPSVADALAAMEAGDHQAAASAAEAVIAAGGDCPPLRALWARALGNRGLIEDAARVAADATERFPLDAELRYLHGELLIEAGDADAAAAQASAAVYLDPDLAVGHLVLGRAQMARGRPDLARRSFRTAATLLDATTVPLDQGDKEELSRYAATYVRLTDSERDSG